MSRDPKEDPPQDRKPLTLAEMVARGASLRRGPGWSPSPGLIDAIADLERADELPAPDPVVLLPEKGGQVVVTMTEAAEAYVGPTVVRGGLSPRMPTGPVKIRDGVDPRRMPTLPSIARSAGAASEGAASEADAPTSVASDVAASDVAASEADAATTVASEAGANEARVTKKAEDASEPGAGTREGALAVRVARVDVGARTESWAQRASVAHGTEAAEVDAHADGGRHPSTSDDATIGEHEHEQMATSNPRQDDRPAQDDERADARAPSGEPERELERSAAVTDEAAPAPSIAVPSARASSRRPASGGHAQQQRRLATLGAVLAAGLAAALVFLWASRRHDGEHAPSAATSSVRATAEPVGAGAAAGVETSAPPSCAAACPSMEPSAGVATAVTAGAGVATALSATAAQTMPSAASAHPAPKATEEPPGSAAAPSGSVTPPGAAPASAASGAAPTVPGALATAPTVTSMPPAATSATLTGALNPAPPPPSGASSSPTAKPKVGRLSGSDD